MNKKVKSNFKDLIDSNEGNEKGGILIEKRKVEVRFFFNQISVWFKIVEGKKREVLIKNIFGLGGEVGGLLIVYFYSYNLI